MSPRPAPRARFHRVPRRLLLALGLLAGAAPMAGATIAPSPIDSVLTQTATAAALRARLRGFAAAREGTDAAAAGEAWLRIGQSFAAGGAPDSAIDALRLAVQKSPGPDARIALATALLRRSGPGDAADAAAALAPLGPAAQGQPPAAASLTRGMLGWAQLALGHPDSAARWFETAGDGGPMSGMEWRLRRGQVALAAGDREMARRMLLPVAVASRGRDPGAMNLLGEAAGEDPGRAVGRLVAERDRREQQDLSGWGAKPLSIRGADGAGLHGALLAAARPRARAVVLLVAPGDSLALYDSLGAGLRASGFAVLVLEPRGLGGSASPAWPRVESWAGREELLARATAADLHGALAVLAKDGNADTSRVALGGAQGGAALAIRVAAASPRVAALLLVSPTPRPWEWGPLRSLLAARRLPAFYQLAVEEHFTTWDESDVLYQGGNRPASRVVESRGPGHGVAQFRGDPDLMPRIATWLREALGAASAPSRPGTPRAPRRK